MQHDQILMPGRWMMQSGNLLYCRVAPIELKELRPLSGSKPGGLELEAEHLVLKVSGLDFRNSTGLGEAVTTFLEGNNTGLTQRDQGKSNDFIGAWSDLPAGLRKSPGLAVAHCGDKDTGRTIREYLLL